MNHRVVSSKAFMMWLAALGLLVVGFTVGRTRADGPPAVPVDFSEIQVEEETLDEAFFETEPVLGESEIADGADRSEDVSLEIAERVEPAVRTVPPVEAPPIVVAEPPVVVAEPPVVRPRPTVAAPAPSPPPVPREPESISLLVPAGTSLVIRFERTLSSHTSETGEPFRVELTEDAAAGGRTAIPAGSVIHGTVTEADPAKKIGGRAMLALDFRYLELPSGEKIAINAGFAERGKSQSAKDAGIIAGSVVGGAILGEAVDEGEGTAIGAVVGGVVGAVVAKGTRAKRVEVPAGTVTTLELLAPVTVDVFVD